MKARLMAGLLGVACAVSFAFAQDVTPSIGAKSKALLFSFSGLSNLGANNFNGGLGGKFFLSDALALRGSLNYAHSHAEILPNRAPLTGEVGVDGFNNVTTLGASVGAEFHFGKARVSPYAGGNLNFSMTNSDSKDAGIGTSANPYPQTELQDYSAAAGTTIAISALAGVEFFVTKEISLSAEYQFGFSTTSHPDRKQITNNGATTTTTPVGGSSGLNVSTTSLTLAVYF